MVARRRPHPPRADPPAARASCSTPPARRRAAAGSPTSPAASSSSARRPSAAPPPAGRRSPRTPRTSAPPSPPPASACCPTRARPVPPPRRQLVHPALRRDGGLLRRGRADEPGGPVMMTSTAAVQVNLDIGRRPRRRPRALAPAARGRRRPGRRLRQLADARGPPHRLEVRPAAGLAAARPGAHRRRRRAPTRSPPGRSTPLDAHVMLRPPRRRRLVRRARHHASRDWVGSAEGRRPPRTSRYHLTHAVPAGRGRAAGSRCATSTRSPGSWWPVPVAVLAALVEDPDAAEAAAQACARPRRLGRRRPATGCRPRAARRRPALLRRRARRPGRADEHPELVAPGRRLPRPLRRAAAAARPTTRSRRTRDRAPSPGTSPDALDESRPQAVRRRRARARPAAAASA